MELLTDVGKALGCEIDVKQFKVRPTAERFANVRQAIRFALRQRYLSGWQVEMLMGHITFLAFLRRETLAIFHATYRFMRSEYQRFTRLWSSCREELTCFMGAMVLIEADRARGWMPEVYAADASLSGYGITTS